MSLSDRFFNPFERFVNWVLEDIDRTPMPPYMGWWLPLIKKAIDYIEANLQYGVTAEEAAEHIGAFEGYFSDVFSVIAQCPPRVYIRRRQLVSAAEELLLGKSDVLELTEAYDYSSDKSFIRAFRRFHKCTPQELASGSKLLARYPKLLIHMRPKLVNSSDSGESYFLDEEGMPYFVVSGGEFSPEMRYDYPMGLFNSEVDRISRKWRRIAKIFMRR